MILDRAEKREFPEQRAVIHCMHCGESIIPHGDADLIQCPYCLAYFDQTHVLSMDEVLDALPGDDTLTFGLF